MNAAAAYVSTYATAVATSAAITRYGVTKGESKIGNWNLCPERANRSLRWIPRAPIETDAPTTVSPPTFRVTPRSTSIAAVPSRNPNRYVLRDLATLRAKKPASCADPGPKETSNFQLFRPLARWIPVLTPLVGPTVHVRWPLLCLLRTRFSPTSRPRPFCALEYEYASVPAVCSESCLCAANVAAEWFDPVTAAASQLVCSDAVRRNPSTNPPAPIPRDI